MRFAQNAEPPLLGYRCFRNKRPSRRLLRRNPLPPGPTLARARPRGEVDLAFNIPVPNIGLGGQRGMSCRCAFN
eukprot:11223761-Lingulodinium_polyedra.AAC.1